MKYKLLYVIAFLYSSAFAEDVRQPITVSEVQHGVFQHFEDSGRTLMAVTKGTVGIVWEDNRSGTPQVYIAFKDKAVTAFTKPIQVSNIGPAYEPAIATINGRFVVGWEAKEHLWLRSVSTTHQGPVVTLGHAPGRQITLASAPQQQAVAAWSEKDSKNYHIRVARLALENNTLKIDHNRAVDTSADRKEQLYPSVAVTTKGMVVAWEDRRQGATRIFTAFAPTGMAFEPYQLLNDFRYSRIRKYGSGTGAMRVVLSGDQKSNIMAVWLDKRDFVQGYDVYAAYSNDGGRTFGKNEKVQDPLGDNIPQWHPTLAMSPAGRIVAAWDDPRDGSPDIWFSYRDKQQWRGDDVWPGGSGDGAQTQPALVLEGEKLHAAWLDRHGGKSAILYSQP